MDPDVCYYEMFCAMRDKDFRTARDRAIDLNHWLFKGGFYPQKYSKVEVDSYLANVMKRTKFLCVDD